MKKGIKPHDPAFATPPAFDGYSTLPGQEGFTKRELMAKDFMASLITHHTNTTPLWLRIKYLFGYEPNLRVTMASFEEMAILSVQATDALIKKLNENE